MELGKTFDAVRGMHSLEVASLMYKAALLINEQDAKKEYNIDPKECFFLGYAHDIGYQFTKNGKNHAVVGGKLLKKLGFKDWEIVSQHGNKNSTYDNIYLFLLDYFDMHINYDAGHVNFNERIKDIKNRYGKNSPRVQLAIDIKNNLVSSYYFQKLDSLLQTIL